MLKVPKILCIQPEPWHMNICYEYISRYLADEFLIEVGAVSYPPFGKEYLDRFPSEVLGLKNPDDYDLLVPIWPGHWSVDKETYKHKMAPVLGMIGESPTQGVSVVGSATPFTDKFLENSGVKSYHKLRFGIDTSLFKPFRKVREDNLLHVGMVGTLHHPSRLLKEVFPYIKDIPGVRLMFCTTQMISNLHDLNFLGGWDARECIFDAGKQWVTLPNVYNRFDVVLRTDQDPGISFPVLEAASCGVPVIATNGGIDHFFTQAGGGILLDAPEKNGDGTSRNWYFDHPDWVGEKTREAIIWMRDHPKQRKQMGIKARTEVLKNWTWEKVIPAWKKFFREGVKSASSHS